MRIQAAPVLGLRALLKSEAEASLHLTAFARHGREAAMEILGLTVLLLAYWALRRQDHRRARWRRFVAGVCALQVMMMAPPRDVAAPGALSGEMRPRSARMRSTRGEWAPPGGRIRYGRPPSTRSNTCSVWCTSLSTS